MIRIEKLTKETKGLVDIYTQFVDTIGLENTRKLYNNFKGQQITFPKRLYTKDYIIDEVRHRYNGKNLKELAKEFDYTERYLRQLLKDKF